MYKKLKLEITQPDIIMYSDIVYSNPFNSFLQENIPLKIHLLRPFYDIEHWETCPLLVWVSGGAFRSSSPARNIPELMEYARQGYVVASVQYRVSSESCFPTQIQDVKAAIRFLKHHHEKYGIDPDRVVIAGHSAGAYLAAIVNATEGVKLFETEEWNDVPSSVKGAVCMSGGDIFTDVSIMNLSERKTPALELFLDNDCQDSPENAKAAAVMPYVSEKTPPYLLIHGEKDSVVPAEVSRRFYQELTKAGVDVDFYEIEGADHGTAELRQPEVQQIMLEFFNRAVGVQKK